MVDWTAKRQKAGTKFVRQSLRTAADPSIGNLALLAYRGVKGLRAIVNSEEHFLDTSLSTSLVAGTPHITQLNAIAQGDYSSQRTGNSSLMTHLHMNEYFQTNTTDPTILREIIFYDKQQVSDTAPVGSDLLQDATSPYSFYNKEKKGRFQIISDRQWVMVDKTNPIKSRRFSKKLNKHVLFNGIDATDVQKNGLYRFLVSNKAVGVAGTMRLGFHDN